MLLWIAVFLNNNNPHIFGDINCSVFSPHLQTDGLQQENVPQFGCLWATWLTFKWRKPLLLERENPTDCRRASNKGNRGCSGGLWKGTQCRYWRRSGLLSPTSTAKMNKLGPVRSLSNFLNRCPHYAVTECDMISRSKMTEWVLTADEHSLLRFFFSPSGIYDDRFPHLAGVKTWWERTGVCKNVNGECFMSQNAHCLFSPGLHKRYNLSAPEDLKKLQRNLFRVCRAFCPEL